MPFAFVDNGVVSSLTYFYAVTAFDVNSVASGPSSLEGAPIARSVTPRAPAGNAKSAILVESVQGDDGEALDLLAPWPNIDPETGTFDGPVPPTPEGRFGFLASVAEALPAGDIALRIDSAGSGFNGNFGRGNGVPPYDNPFIYVTMEAGGNVVTAAVNSHHPNFNSAGNTEWELSAPLVPYDSTLSNLVGLNFQDSTVRMPVKFEGIAIPGVWQSQSVATASGRYGVSGYGTSRYLAHSRWFDEGGSEPPDPTITGRADPAHNAGALTGVNNIWAPAAYRTGASFVSVSYRGVDYASGSWYPADFVVTWGSGGAVEIRDVTHHVNLSYNGGGFASGYAFLNLSDVLASGMDQAGFGAEFDLTGSGVYDIINYQHLIAVEPACTEWWAVGAFDCIVMSETAEVSPLDYDSDGVKDDDGIVLVVNGEPFFMGTGASLPAAGTQWHLRAITGKMTADCQPSLGEIMTDCSNYTFEPNPVRPTNVPGLKYVINVQQQFAVNPADSVDLDRVHTVPDPYYVTNSMEISTSRKILKWVNLPAQAIIRVYSLSGVLVKVVEHNDPAGGGEAVWDLRNRNNQFVASGVYFYHIETPNGQSKTGRMTVVNFAQ